MKRILTLLMFLLCLISAAICSAEAMYVTDLKPAQYINQTNQFVKLPDGKPFFPDPKLLPQYSTAKEKMYITQIQVKDTIGMVQINTGVTDNINSIVIYSANDKDGRQLATNLAMILARGLGLNEQEMNNIFLDQNPDGKFKTYCSASQRNISVVAAVDPVSEAFTVKFTASDN